jgi:hypothetical protein
VAHRSPQRSGLGWSHGADDDVGRQGRASATTRSEGTPRHVGRPATFHGTPSSRIRRRAKMDSGARGGGAHGIVPPERTRVTARHARPCCAAASLTFFFCAVVCRVGHTGSWPSLQRPSWRPPPFPAPSVRRSRHAPRPRWSPLPRHDGAHVPWAHGTLRQRPTLHGRVSLATRTTECLSHLSGWPPFLSFLPSMLPSI